jgi:hypothetical protein
MRRLRKALIGLAVLVATVLALHVGIGIFTRIEPPQAEIHLAKGGYTTMRAGVRETYLEGSPEELGATHANLVRDRMIVGEDEVWALFEKLVPFSPARTLIMDVSRVRYRHVDRGMPEARRREIAAEARAFDPDPFASRLPTYHRLVFLHAMYDIALSFERSPLIGCTAFGVTGKDGHVLVGRAFDFEAADFFDRDKEVAFYRPDGAIPFTSVAWPGLTGVVSGMNLEGVTVVVNGARARDPRTEGMPVVFSLREVLEGAHDTNEAIAILSKQDVMVSHIVFVADAKGHFAAVERAPGEAAFVREGATVTNHFEGPLAGDARNQTVRATTTSVARRERIDELVGAAHDLDARGAVAILRDHGCHGTACELGDRRAIDALIATHGVVFDATDRALWVSRGPHLSGAFVRFDLKRIFTIGRDPLADPPPEIIEDDPILADGKYDEGRARALRPTGQK